MTCLSNIPPEMRWKIMRRLDTKSLLRLGATCRKFWGESQKQPQYYNRVWLMERRKIVRLILNSNKLILEFHKIGESKTRVKCVNLAWSSARQKVFWTEIVVENVYDCVLRIVKEFLRRIAGNLREFYCFVQQKLRSRVIRGLQLPKNLRNLASFEIDGCSQQIDMVKWKFVDFKSLANVRNRLNISYTTISFEQLLELRAEKIEIYRMSILTSQNLRDYIEMWAENRLHSNFRELRVSAGKSRSSKMELVNLAGLQIRSLPYGTKLLQSKVNHSDWLSISNYAHFFWIRVVDENGRGPDGY